MIKAAPHPTVLIQYLAAVMAGTGFGAFFNCSAKDIVIAAFASLIVPQVLFRPGTFILQVWELYMRNCLRLLLHLHSALSSDS